MKVAASSTLFRKDEPAYRLGGLYLWAGLIRCRLANWLSFRGGPSGRKISPEPRDSPLPIHRNGSTSDIASSTQL